MQPGDAHLWFADALLPEGWASGVRVTVKGARIAAVAIDAAPLAQDERHGVAVPGLCNLHSHAFQRGMAGLTERRGSSRDSFWSWRTLMYAFAQKLSPAALKAIAVQLYIEMLKAGYTSVCEFHYLHHDVNGKPYANPAEHAACLIEAAEEAGIGLDQVIGVLER